MDRVPALEDRCTLSVVHFTTEFPKRFFKDGIQAFCLHRDSVCMNVADKGLVGHRFIEAIRNLKVGMVTEYDRAIT